MPLTVKDVQNARPGRLSDGRGLYLLVKPSAEWVRLKKKKDDGEALSAEQERVFAAKPAGAKSWVLRVQQGRDRRDYGLGVALLQAVDAGLPIHRRSSLTLGEAREKARLGRELAKAGINPNLHWRLDVAEERPPTFEEAATEYHRQVSRSWRNGKHSKQWIETLRLYAFPELGALPVDEIDAPMIQRVLMPIWLTKGETARRVRQRIGVVLDYAHGKGWRSGEAPMRAVNQLMGGIKQTKGGNFAAMPYRDLPAFMAGLGSGGESVGRLALRFLLLTVCRSGEVRKARWKEMDLPAAEWRIPPENTKTGRVHVVPLVPEAVKILQAISGLFGGEPEALVFPGLKGAMSDATLAKVMRVGGGGAFTVHGLRSTFRDWAADSGFNNDWAEAALAHSVSGQEGKTVAAYKRTTFFDQRRDKLMPAWTSYALGDQRNVVTLVTATA